MKQFLVVVVVGFIIIKIGGLYTDRVCQAFHHDDDDNWLEAPALPALPVIDNL